MHPYDPNTALEELNEEALLPHPVHLRDLILRARLAAGEAMDLNRAFQSYLAQFGEAQKTAREILEKLAGGAPKQP
jgi:hypothetical protein